MTAGYLKRTDNGYLVGAIDADSDYVGPEAEIMGDDVWLHITTCPYEGAAMINIEALPFLIEALLEIQAKRVAHSTGRR